MTAKTPALLQDHFARARAFARARHELTRRTAPLTVAEAAGLLGIAPDTLLVWRRKGLVDWTPAAPISLGGRRGLVAQPCVPPSALRALLGMEPSPTPE